MTTPFSLPFDQAPSTMALIDEWALEIVNNADGAAGQALIEALWKATQDTDPNVATMCLVCATYVARTLQMIEDQGIPAPTLFRVIAKLVAIICAAQDKADRKAGGSA
jgi:hypothetical protein